uniref:Jade family PHD finger 2 n=1 Tax=Oreochromis niloticus TaxID=8128 RepID=A0A669BVD3_ORENI
MCLAPNDLLISGNRPPSRTEDVSVPEADSDQGQVTSWSRSSKNMGTSSTWVRHQHKKPSEVFRTDFITAMKLPDSAQLGPDDFYVLSDPWRQEWEKGVQVPANLEAIPEPVVRSLPESTGGLSNNGQEREGDTRPPPTQLYSCYDLDDLDVAWLQIVNQEFRQMGLPELDELTMECVLVELESVCEEKMQQAIETEEGLGIEYDEDVVCDVCRSPEGEDGNEMVFCDKCNVCVHQACYGILKVPQGNWLCRTCALGVQPKCLLCPKRGGALKPTRSGTKWVHVSCALWIPEVSIGCPEKMEPITKVSHIPASRWALSCSLCREHTGTCIQVRNLCYMVTRREKMKHTLCDLQEKIFHLQIQLLEEDMAGEKTQKGEKRKQNGVKDKGKERRKNSPEKKKERWKSENGSMLKELAPAGRREFAQPNDGELHAVHLENTPVGAQTEREQQAPCSCTTNHSGPASDAPVCSCCVRWQQPSTAKRLWASVAEEKSGHVSRKGEKNKGSSKTVHHPLHHHQTRSSDLHRDPPPQPPISKMDSCHISEDNSPWDGIHAGNGVVSRAGSGFTVGSNPPVSGLGFTMPDAGTIFRGGTPRHRLSRQGKSRVRGVTRGVAGFESMDLPLAGKDVSLLDAAETDGYFSDGEQSDSDTRTGGRKLRLPQLHSGNEDLLRRSVLAS